MQPIQTENNNTVVYTFTSLPLGIVLSLVLAIALNQKLPGTLIFRAIFFIPADMRDELVGIETEFPLLWLTRNRLGGMAHSQRQRHDIITISVYNRDSRNARPGYVNDIAWGEERSFNDRRQAAETDQVLPLAGVSR